MVRLSGKTIFVASVLTITTSSQVRCRLIKFFEVTRRIVPELQQADCVQPVKVL